MRISLFGSLAEAIGREVVVPVPDGSTIRDLRRALAARYPDAEPILMRPAVRACIDDEMVGDDAEVPASGEIAFFPPLSGG